jgi:hypothetical protein
VNVAVSGVHSAMNISHPERLTCCDVRAPWQGIQQDIDMIVLAQVRAVGDRSRRQREAVGIYASAGEKNRSFCWMEASTYA